MTHKIDRLWGVYGTMTHTGYGDRWGLEVASSCHPSIVCPSASYPLPLFVRFVCRTPRVLFPVPVLPSVFPPAHALGSIIALLSGPPSKFAWRGLCLPPVDPSLASPPAPRPAFPSLSAASSCSGFGVATPHHPSFQLRRLYGTLWTKELFVHARVLKMPGRPSTSLWPFYLRMKTRAAGPGGRRRGRPRAGSAAG